MAYVPQPTTGTSFGNLLSVITLHYHRLYSISSLEVNLSSEDLKQLCRQKPSSQVHVGTRKLILRPDLF